MCTKARKERYAGLVKALFFLPEREIEESQIVEQAEAIFDLDKSG